MKCNILIIGQTGVGKSSLINYLAGDKIAEAGIPKKTGGLTRGFHSYPIEINGQECNVTDSEGLETSHEKHWLNLMDNVLWNNNAKKNLSDWYHIVVYCVGANSGRVQDLELQMIEKLWHEGYGVVIALTKADLATEEELVMLADTINSYFDHKAILKYVPICSKETRGSQLEGKEELSEAILEAWRVSLIGRLPEYIFSFIDNMKSWGEQVIKWIYQQDIGFLGLNTNKVIDGLNAQINKKIAKCNDEIKSKQNKAQKDIRSVYRMFDEVLNISINHGNTMTIHSEGKRIENSGPSFVEAMLSGLLIPTIILNPLIGIPASIIAILLGISNKEKKKEKIVEAFIKEYERLWDEYYNLYKQYRRKLIDDYISSFE